MLMLPPLATINSHSKPPAGEIMTDKHPWKMRYAPHVGLAAPDIPLFLHQRRARSGCADRLAGGPRLCRDRG